MEVHGHTGGGTVALTSVAFPWQSASGRAGATPGRLALPHTGQPQVGARLQEGHQEAHGLLHYQGEACQQPVSIQLGHTHRQTDWVLDQVLAIGLLVA